jgi:hypothetical protein
MKSGSRCMVARLWHLSKPRSICKRDFGVLFGKTALRRMSHLGNSVCYIVKDRRVLIFTNGGTKC